MRAARVGAAIVSLDHGGTYTGGTHTWTNGDSYEGALHDVQGAINGQGTLTSSKGWSCTGALARNRPTAGVLTEASGRHFAVTYAADCAIILYAPTPATKVRACVRVPMRVREGPAAHGPSAHIPVLSLTVSRFSLSLPLSIAVSFCVSLSL